MINRTKIQQLIRNIAQRYFLIVLCLLVFLGFYHVVMILKYGTAFFNGSFYALVSDDVMISMRYAQNLAHGAGLVFNPGENVEGFTNPLWTFFLAGLHCVPAFRPYAAFFLLFVNILLSFGILFMLTRFWGHRPSLLSAGLVAAIFYATFPNHAYFSFIGFEIYLVIFILVYSLWRIERLNLFDAFLLGLLPLSHGTMMLPWLILVGAIYFMTPGSLGSRFFRIFLALSPFLAYEVFRILYFHDFLPNTYWLKAGTGISKIELLQKGILYVGNWAGSVFILMALGFYAFLAMRKNRKFILITLVVIGNIVSVIWLGGDIFLEYRFLFPSSVLLAALAGYGVIIFMRRLVVLPSPERFYFTVLLIMSLFYAWTFYPIFDYKRMVPAYEEGKAIQKIHLMQGLLLRDITLPGETIALFAVGYIGYYSDRYVVDMLGKVDKHIARVSARPNNLTGHNKTDFYYVFNKHPDFVEAIVEPQDLANVVMLRDFVNKSSVSYMLENVLNPIFQGEYSAHPIRTSQGSFTQLYARTAEMAERRSPKF